MPKTRLNASMREALRKFADKGVTAPAEGKAVEAAYDRAATLVRQQVDKKYPVAEMAVLEKHDAGRIDHCVRGGDADGTFFGFRFREGDARAPYLPRQYCNARSFSWDKATAEAIRKHAEAELAYEKAREAKLRVYATLINGSRHAEDVLEVWPAAAEAIPSAASAGLPATLSAEQIEMIRSDNASPKVAV